MTVKFTGLTVLGSFTFTGQLLSGHRCWCTLDVEHHIKVHTDHQVCIADRSSQVLLGGFLHIWRTSVNEFSFLTKLLTVMVCRQSILISTILELLSTALNCRIIIKTSAHRFYEPDQSLTHFQLFSTGLSLAGDVDMQRLDSSEAFFHKLLIIYSRIMFHAI